MRKFKSLFWWLFAVIFTIIIASYQRMTGPSYPKDATVTLNNNNLKFKLIRSHADGDAEIKLVVPDKNITGKVTFKRYKSFDKWSTVEMKREGDNLLSSIPHQPPAGKIEYFVSLGDDKHQVNLTPEPVIIRFTGKVPPYILIPHILIMFLAMLFSTRTGIEALTKGAHTFRYTTHTVILFFLGGLILGPIVQHFAFGFYWTGWPFGGDLTDNKT